ncbi:MAG: glycine cleavage system aminomethyltransferase GcvT [Bacteroidales bacterium]|nr:glycine cleavage system aminomethyltransferase GcvT [Lentimicrobiaceae bacterium]MDD5694015.1 glycine cleavage system aminomethyltransferase GcvT [Bacteroidales bacterium]
MKFTAFTKFHEQLGAKMVEFAGYWMPVQFEGVNVEHETVRNSLGVFDVSHMGEIWIRGPKALDLIQFIASNDASKLTDGKVQYSCFPNGKGGIVDDLLVYRIAEGEYFLVVNAANIEKDWNWIRLNGEKMGLKVGTDMVNASDEYAQLAVQGPLALKAMQKLTTEPVVDMEYYTHKTIDFAGVKDVLFATTGYTGSGGCEIYMKNDVAPAIYQAVFEAGKEFGIKSIGLGARDTLRLEMGFCLYGNDIDDTTSPIEAGLGWITKFADYRNFMDMEYLLKQKQEGVTRRLKGFEMIDKGIPRQHYPILNQAGEKIGEVTSGTMAPSLKKAIGMGYVNKGYWDADNEIHIEVRGRLLKAKIVKTPFYKP